MLSGAFPPEAGLAYRGRALGRGETTSEKPTASSENPFAQPTVIGTNMR